MVQIRILCLICVIVKFHKWLDNSLNTLGFRFGNMLFTSLLYAIVSIKLSCRLDNQTDQFTVVSGGKKQTHLGADFEISRSYNPFKLFGQQLVISSTNGGAIKSKKQGASQTIPLKKIKPTADINFFSNGTTLHCTATQDAQVGK